MRRSDSCWRFVRSLRHRPLPWSFVVVFSKLEVRFLVRHRHLRREQFRVFFHVCSWLALVEHPANGRGYSLDLLVTWDQFRCWFARLGIAVPGVFNVKSLAFLTLPYTSRLASGIRARYASLPSKAARRCSDCDTESWVAGISLALCSSFTFLWCASCSFSCRMTCARYQVLGKASRDGGDT